MGDGSYHGTSSYRSPIDYASIPYNWGVIQTRARPGQAWRHSVSIPYNWGVIQTEPDAPTDLTGLSEVSIPYNWGVIQTIVQSNIDFHWIVSIPYNWGVIQTSKFFDTVPVAPVSQSPTIGA